MKSKDRFVLDTNILVRAILIDKFIELAVSGNASRIVTGDDDLLVLHPFRGISILSRSTSCQPFELFTPVANNVSVQ
jgi:predicted nucleic acid-binding protein